MKTASSTLSGVQVSKKKFIYSILAPATLAAFMVLIKFIETATHFSFSSLGLRPRVPERLLSVGVFPFLHADWFHLFSNLLPFMFLSTLVVNLFPKISWKIMLFTFGLSGFWTWCFARPGIVIGASGWVYALLGFLLVAGFAKASRQTMVIAGGLAFLYGGMVYGLVPSKPNISWEGHLMGLLAGISGAIYWRNDLKENERIQNFEPFGRTQEPEKEPPYPYWMYNSPHFLDAQRNILHPDQIVWENGRPQIKTEEEELFEANSLNDNKIAATPNSIKPVHLSKENGMNTWHINFS